MVVSIIIWTVRRGRHNTGAINVVSTIVRTQPFHSNGVCAINRPQCRLEWIKIIPNGVGAIIKDKAHRVGANNDYESLSSLK